MVIYNYCSKCGRKIKVDERNPILALSLANTKKAICRDCDPKSKWVPVYPKIEGEGNIRDWGYKVFEMKAGKGLLLIPPKGRSIYIAPSAPKGEIQSLLNSLPEYVQEALTEFETVKRLKRGIQRS